ncbi:phage tail tape measure protein [Nocardia sp. NPDC058058]|uniref:phage tail tape measure protein n=1 Tax=Nocardia sp. NPDC058058 TaxID=3346317 RepID=UPI0036D92249
MAIPVMVSLGATAGAFFSVMKSAEVALLGMANRGEATAAAMSRLATTLSVGTVAAVGVFAAESVHAATEFQTAMTHLVTAADLPKAHVQELGQQFEELSTQVATSATDLANASYYVLSEGYQWDQVSTIMHTAAQLSIEDQADLTDTTRALVTTMHDYGAKSSEATSYGNAFREMLALSGTTMQELAQNMGRVDQTAYALGLNFSQTAGALATLTREGMQGAQAETLLSTAINHLAGDTPKMTAELKGLGINVQQFQQQLASPEGLVGAISTVQQAIKDHLGEDGLVYLQTALKKSKGNLDDFAVAMGKAPTAIQSYVAALGDAMGGSRNLGVILGLTGKNLDDFKSNVDKVSEAFHTGGTDVTGWGDVTETLGFKSKQLSADLQDLAIKMGDHLLPTVTKVADALVRFADYLDHNKTAADLFGIALGVLAAAAMANLILKIGSLIGSLGTLATALKLDVAITALANFIRLTLIPAIVEAVAATARWAYGLAVVAGESAIGGLRTLGTTIRVAVVPALLEAAAATWAWTVAMLANPITWVILIIAALVIEIIIIVRHFNDLKNSTAGLGGALAWLIEILGGAALKLTGLSSVIEYAGAHFDQLKERAIEAVAQIISGVERLIPEVAGRLAAMGAQAIATVLGFVPGFLGAGYNLIMGLIQGIQSAIGAAISAVTGAMSSIYHAALGALGIKSPSLLFNVGVGVPIMQGIAAGIASSKGLVSDQLTDATNPANMRLSGGVGGGLGRAGVLSGGGGEVHYHLTVSGSVFGQGGMEAVAEQLWSQFLRMQQRGTLGFSGSLTVGV